MIAHSQSSRFNGPAIGTLHAQRRGASPPKYLKRSVRVGVIAMPAGDALKHRLVLAGSGVNDTAGRTGLRAVGGWHGDYLPAMFLHFVGQDRLKLVPSSIENSPVQACLLADVPARLGNGAGSRCRHVLGFQVLKDGNPKVPSDAQCRAVVKITPDPSLLGLKPSYTPLSFLFPFGPPLTPGGNALGFAFLGFKTIQALWERQHLSRRQSEGRRNTAINPDGFIVRGAGLMLCLASEGHVPFSGICADRCGSDRSYNWTSSSKLDPADLRNADSRPFRIELSRRDFAPLKPKAFVLSFLPERRELRSAAEEGGECSVEIPKSLLLASSINRCNPIKLVSELGQFARLRKRGDALPLNLQISSPPSLSLLQGEIIYQAANARELREQSQLFGVGRKTVFVAAIDLHGLNDSTLGGARP